MADAGRAMMLYRGLYDSTYTYEKLDVVNHNGSLYISTTDGNLGTEPTDETKWKLFLQGGVADNIQATDTHGLVGEAGSSSFVQLLLDSLASRIGKDGNGDVIEDTYIPKSNVLNTEEEIDANTSEENIAGALAIKSLKSNFANSLDTKVNLIRNSFANVSAREFDLADILIGTDSKFAMLVSASGHVATDKGGSLYFITGMTASQYVQVIRICGDDTYSPKISVEDGKLTVQTYDTNGCEFTILKLLN